MLDGDEDRRVVLALAASPRDVRLLAAPAPCHWASSRRRQGSARQACRGDWGSGGDEETAADPRWAPSLVGPSDSAG